MQVDRKKIGLIGGQGNLPFLIKDALKIQGWDVFILAYYGITPENLTENTPHVWMSLGKIQRAVDSLREHHISYLTLAGKFYRPKLSSLRLDALGRKLLYQLGLGWFGDDALLTTLLRFIHEQGFNLVKTQDILPDLLEEKKFFIQNMPNAQAREDIERGAKILQNLSNWDVGQGIAIQGKRVLGIEAAEGTDACIMRCGLLAEQGALFPKPVYVKMAKIGQSYSVDLPVIGLDTMRALHKAGFQGLGVQANSVLIVDFSQLKHVSQELGVFLWQF
ncbi:hypothetical protein P618_201108 [Holospora obtusa F1]|uniref:UDP-2,3-diacylglucosamine pyrophosphatase LpxI n=1 Tax=Holospora obtusa F1 TaxID=1399147 RepID=W6TCZ4_HOLOB|nr:UDP-2,3-diacylglucosamine diphosphatase LpxI [Holospora obtusa]ETZ06703.1 hypothetical protein P618_201108 [Holospora obtusa F1]